MNLQTSPGVAQQQPTRVRYGVLGLACSLSMITYLDRVCFGSVADNIKEEFALSETQRGMLFSAFALAYAVFEVPSGWLGDVFGPRRTLIRIVLWWSFFTALTGLIWPVPGWVVVAYTVLLTVRFCFGMGEAGAYPNIARAFHSWFPATERGFAQGTVWMAGRLMGGATPLIVYALLYTTREGDVVTTHWRHAFWIFGVLGLLWCLVFWLWFRDRPEDKESVNDAELALINAGKKVVSPGPQSLRREVAGTTETAVQRHDAPKNPFTGVQATPVGTDALGHGGAGNPLGGVHAPDVRMDELGHSGVPWRRLFSSGNLWILCLMYFCASYGWYVNITYLPSYLKTMHGFSKESEGVVVAGLVTGSPLLAGSVACLVGGILTDTFIRRTGNRKWGRRLFGVVGHGGFALCYFASMFAGNVYLFVLAIALAAFWNDITMGSAWASCLDIGRKYSGIVSGCMNTIGNLGGFLAGVGTGVVLDLFRDPSAADPTGTAWKINFMIFGSVYVIAVGCWLLFDSTKPLVYED